MQSQHFFFTRQGSFRKNHKRKRHSLSFHAYICRKKMTTKNNIVFNHKHALRKIEMRYFSFIKLLSLERRDCIKKSSYNIS